MKKELKDQAKEILKLAQNYGVEQNLFFVTTFERYQTQLQILDELRVTIEKDGFFIDKTYVKGETNLYSHPAVTQFNRTTDSANKTVVTLMKIITTLRDRQNGGESDPLLDLISEHGARAGASRAKITKSRKSNGSRLECNVGDASGFESELGAR